HLINVRAEAISIVGLRERIPYEQMLVTANKLKRSVQKVRDEKRRKNYLRNGQALLVHARDGDILHEDATAIMNQYIDEINGQVHPETDWS
ncbi:MAG: hypothetical protein GOV15_01625, partial [Candidatus Diapherotrites archaeon]|nr:hypothetical protein [Candidatus Diapherotrites archaeon]